MESHHGQRIDRQQDSTASTDFGDVTYALPACHPGFTIPAAIGSGNHTVRPVDTHVSRGRII